MKFSPFPFLSGDRDEVRSRADGFLRVTKVGIWMIVFLGIVGMAAANTGNNGLYLVLAFFCAGLAVSFWLCGRNLGGLKARATMSGEAFAGRRSHVAVEIFAGRRARRWLLVGLDARDIDPLPEEVRPALVARLDAGESMQEDIEIEFARRGLHHLRRLRVSSLFPLGFFHQAFRCAVDLKILVYPEILSDVADDRTRGGKSGDDAAPRAGWGHELLSLREYRAGDDPRHIHWKQSARTGDLIYQEHQVEESRRLLVVFDNATTRPLDELGLMRFERRVSEAATLALRELDAGYEVALTTRGEFLDFGEGARQRRAVLEALAMIEPLERTDKPLQLPAQQVATAYFGENPEAIEIGSDSSASSAKRRAA